MYWFIIGALCIIIGVILAIHIHKTDILKVSTIELIIIILMWLAVIVIGLYAICTPIEFKTFETKYELQKELYSNIFFDENFVLTPSIVEINNELFEKQAAKQYLGEWDFTPKKVLDMEPIGVK